MRVPVELFVVEIVEAQFDWRARSSLHKSK
jgi:hypothetical protein